MWSYCETTWKQTMTTHIFAHFTSLQIPSLAFRWDWTASKALVSPQKGDENRSKTKPQDAYLHLSSEETERLNGVSVDEPSHWRDLWMRQQVDTQKVCWFNTSNGRANSNEWWQFEQRRGLLSLSKAKLCSNVIYVSHVVFPFTKPLDTVRHTYCRFASLCVFVCVISCVICDSPKRKPHLFRAPNKYAQNCNFKDVENQMCAIIFIFIHRVA